MSAISQLLAGGDRRSLGRAAEVEQLVLANPGRCGELFECLFHGDEIVRMRASDALEKICREKPGIIQPFLPRLLTDVAAVDQPSVQWHLAQMFGELSLTNQERSQAVAILKRNLDQSDDWIVINLTMQALAEFAEDDVALGKYLRPRLRKLQKDPRRSIARRATRLLESLRS